MKHIHKGKNVKRVRVLLEIPQKEVAAFLGAGWTQKKVSIIESSEIISPHILTKIAQCFSVDVETFSLIDVPFVHYLLKQLVLKCKKNPSFFDTICAEHTGGDCLE